MAARLLATLLSALALLGSGYWWGHTATDNAWAARQAKADAQTAQRRFIAWEHADEAAASYAKKHQDLEDRYADMDRRYQDLRRRHPLLVATEPACAPAAPDQPPEVEPSPPSPGLTLAAVRMWNGYLTATDQATGACGAADPPEGADAAESACDQASGLTLDDAWENHRINAAACADDRERYRRLIDYLKQNTGD